MMEDYELKNYILKFAKEQYVEKRDNHLDTLPHSVSPSDFYIGEFNEYKNELERFKSLTDDEAKIEEIAYRKKEIDYYKDYIEMKNQEINNLKNRLVKIQKWKCGDSLLHLKNNIIENIDSELCMKTKRLKYDPIFEHELSGKEFKEEMIERYQRIVDDISYDVKREREWANKTNKLLKDLKYNLGDW